MELSISIEAMFGLSWKLWQDMIRDIDAMGFDGLFRSDHLMVGKPGADSLELVTSLTYLATVNRRMHFGPLVSPLSIHNPVMLARQAMAIDELSGGRMVLGLGAGWHDEEHAMFGYRLGDKKTRMERFAEGVELIHHLSRSQEPVTYQGKFFETRGAVLLPRTAVRIMVGGNGATRTLPLVARFADAWNCQVAEPAAFGEMNARLDEMIRAAGREPGAVKRTVIVPVLCVRSEKDLQRHVAAIQQHAPPFSQSSAEEIRGWLYGLKGIIGSPQQIVDGLAAYQEHGAEEVILEWFGLYDREGLGLLGSEVLPKLRETGKPRLS